MKRQLRVAWMGVAAAAATLSAGWAASDDGPSSRWVATWSAPPMAAGSALTAPRSFENQTIRHVVHVSVGGRRVRVRLSNAFGAQPLRIGGARVALHDEDASIVPGTDRVLTFAGRTTITIPTGAAALSDPVDLAVATRGDLAVSVYVADNTGPATYHESSDQTTYISEPGDFTGAVTL